MKFRLSVSFMLLSLSLSSQVQLAHVQSSDQSSQSANLINDSGLDMELQAASRFLSHASLGWDIEDIKWVADNGLEDWLDQQMSLLSSNYAGPTIDVIEYLYDACISNLGVEECRMRFNVNRTMFRYVWWNNIVNGSDRLRQRVALALSEILVLSDESALVNFPHGVAHYFDILMEGALGNYEELLLDITLNPSMGFYLSHINNPRSNEELNIHPDENYAREIMQLFTIGLYELNEDGSRKLDSEGIWIDSYDNNDIKELAKVFTGLSGSKWADVSNQRPVEFGRNFARYSLLDPMKMYQEWHEDGPKIIVGDKLIQDSDGMRELEEAIAHLARHENTAPFISKQLIQKLVKSNPSPEYVQRVARIFKDNGSAQYGDMKAVVKAIFMDQEAMECYWYGDPDNGMLKSPVNRMTQMLIALKAESANGTYWNPALIFNGFMDQHPMSSPTVFNFYRPDYVPNSDFAYQQLVGPEFQILNSSTSSNYINYMLLALMGDYLNGRYGIRLPHLINEYSLIPYISDQEAFKAELTDPLWMDLAYSPSDLLDYLDILLVNGMLDETTKESIVESIQPDSLLDAPDKSYYALFMIMIHPDFLILK